MMPPPCACVRAGRVSGSPPLSRASFVVPATTSDPSHAHISHTPPNVHDGLAPLEILARSLPRITPSAAAPPTLMRIHVTSPDQPGRRRSVCLAIISSLPLVFVFDSEVPRSNSFQESTFVKYLQKRENALNPVICSLCQVWRF